MRRGWRGARTAAFILAAGTVMLASQATTLGEQVPVWSHPDHYLLSNGCRVNARGIGDCGPLVGAAVGGNSDPTPLEQQLGRQLAVHRTYYQADQLDAAVAAARQDLSAGRIPWLSFKLPYPWVDMAAGRGDDWARGVAAALNRLPGPVWVAFHHEPENDQPDIEALRVTQERLGPELRSGAPNAAFTVILTGWNQFHRPAQFGLGEIWPHTTVDLAGFDLYASASGKGGLSAEQFSRTYLVSLSTWARTQGVAWGLAETGIDDEQSSAHPKWIQEVRNALAEAGGQALIYFDSELNSTASWPLDTPVKLADFRAALNASPSLPPR
ncbi:MAG: hypothetical protein QM779_00410 [Propionicimonas sp.]|uniref:hypothetical protein n=1 Tax=Propionicimonas sp. TaxID=1955623 RepID=UPI003D1102F3